jgi:hypothetical protein
MGGFVASALYPGTYYLATNENNISYIDQLYDHIPCYGGPLAGGCDATSGAALTVGFDDHITGVSFELMRTGGISGQLTDEVTGGPVARFDVKVFSSTGDELQVDFTDGNGFYYFNGLDAGTYFVATDGTASYHNHYNELYDDIPCWNGPPYACDPTKGTPVAVSLGQVTRFVDFVLTPESISSSSETGISGAVINSDTGEPIPTVIIDIWDTGANHVTSVATDNAGSYFADLDAGTYYVTTDNYMGWTNMIWNDIKCPQGSAFEGACAPDLGDPVTVVRDRITTDINFAFGWFLFEDGFESGDTSAWSHTVQ